MKHATTPQPATTIDVQRLALVEKQLTDLSRKHVVLGRRHRDLRQRHAATAVALRWLLVAYRALARARQADRAVPVRVLDTGTPGVEATRP